LICRRQRSISARSAEILHTIKEKYRSAEGEYAIALPQAASKGAP
jgi:hypothetical protein